MLQPRTSPFASVYTYSCASPLTLQCHFPFCGAREPSSFNIRDRSVAQRYIIRGYDILANVKRDCRLSITTVSTSDGSSILPMICFVLRRHCFMISRREMRRQAKFIFMPFAQGTLIHCNVRAAAQTLRPLSSLHLFITDTQHNSPV